MPQNPRQCGGARGRGREIRRVVTQNRSHRFGRRVAPERGDAGEHLVSHDAQAEEVGASIDSPAARLLRRHVCGRADRSDVLQRLCGVGRAGVRVHRVELGDPEVEDLHVAVARDEDVGRFDVAVHEAMRMRGVQAARDLAHIFDRSRERERPAMDLAGKCLPVEQLGHHVGCPVVTADVMNREDVRVGEACDRQRFLLEATETIGTGGEGG